MHRETHTAGVSPQSEHIPSADPSTIAFWRSMAGELRAVAGSIERAADRLAAGTLDAQRCTALVDRVTAVADVLERRAS